MNTVRRTPPLIFDKSTESTWRLAGDWREACAELFEEVDSLKQAKGGSVPVRRSVFVTFHQSYGYEEFVEGLRPRLEDADLSYEIRPGVFKQLCERARLDPAHRYVMVIDEINRGNVAKIFGELITLLEPDKRLGSPNEVLLVLPSSGESFGIPRNVDLIGTMNTADRSLALLDIALRRRFDFVEMLPDPTVLEGLDIETQGTVIDLSLLLRAINDRIEALYDRDHTIGHAYFVKLKEISDAEVRFAELKATFKNRIIPLLQEYFFEDWQKIRLVLGDNQKKAEDQFIRALSEVKVEQLFGTSDEFDGSMIKPRFSIQDTALDRPAAYVGIYRP